MPPGFLVLFILAPLSTLTALAAFGLSFVLGRRERFWLHVARAIGAACLSCAALPIVMVCALAFSVFGAPSPLQLGFGRGIGVAMGAALIAAPIVGGFVGAILTRPLVRVAYIVIRWMATAIGAIEG